MRVHTIPRDTDSYQRPVELAQVEALCRRTFGDDAALVSIDEIGLGTYNNTYAIDLGAGPVILRVAPPVALQLRSERHLMRNEHAGAPYLAPIAAYLPRTLGIDFTHELIDRDYLFQTLLPGRPAPEGLDRYERSQWGSFFRDMGSIARAIHDVRGERFGTPAGPTFASWSEAVLASLEDALADHEALGLDASDLRELIGRVVRCASVLDEVTEPRLLHGDLWTVNVMLAEDAEEPRITGVCDSDRLSWGDPMADWPILAARRRPGPERDAFWETYGRLADTAEDEVRWCVYRARHVVGARLERFRLGKLGELPDTYRDLAELLEQLPR